eukprot:symbB.v1.2.007208.t1/scaffold439.1/size205343/11
MSRSSVASLEYWEDFYDSRQSAYDTLFGYEDLRPLFLGLLQLEKSQRASVRLLHVGCGTSNVTDGLVRDGFRQILNIDFSEVVIKLMSERWLQNDLQSVQWRQMDLTDLSQLPSGSFDLALEKFTLDAILCEAKEDAFDPKGLSAIHGLHRVLAPDGIFISVAWGAERRQKLLRSGGLFDVQVHQLPGDSARQRPWVYFCRKLVPSTRTHDRHDLVPTPRDSDGVTVECIEKDDELTIVVDVGHVSRDMVTLDVSSDQLRLEGHISRSFSFPFVIDVESAKARWLKDSSRNRLQLSARRQK